MVLPIAGASAVGPGLSDELGVQTTEISVMGRQDTHFALLMRLADARARAAAFRSYGRSSLAAHLSLPVLADLRAALGQHRFDLIHIGRSYLADILNVLDGGNVNMDLDEDEWTSYCEIAVGQREIDPAGAAWAEAEATALSALLRRSAPRIARHFIASAFDAELIHQRYHDLTPEVVENAVSIPPQPPRRDDGATLLFLGSFGYIPNVDAANWLVRDIWPLVRARSLQPLRLLIAGRDASRVSALRDHDGVDVLGEVKEIADAYAGASLFVAPLRAGAGTRLKLLEAAAHRVPIVTTNLGLRGLRLMPGRDVMIGDGTAGFAEAVLESLANPAVRTARAEAALVVVREHYDRRVAVERLACRLRGNAAT
jgi:glycosyltransferase involved in cell wall biosynthesis